MILRTMCNSGDSDSAGDGYVPAWPVVDRVQRQRSERYWLVTQPDHSLLSGQIAAAFDGKRFPWLTPALIECIGRHDEGWRNFDGAIPSPAPPHFDAQGKPLTFVELVPKLSVPAWRASIENAARLDSLGGAVVSRHFMWLAQYRLRMASDQTDDSVLLRQFAAFEEERQAKFASSDAASRLLEEAVNVLQFCDLLSLYLCCGATENVEFPQEFEGKPVRMSRRGGRFVLTPSPIAKPVTLQCPAFVPNEDGSFETRAIVCEMV